ncbi:UNKNOWN [Stylonychia lemnae]|uniref:Uncharacterized protein n=1 Tax=Stylonychia lemnae TaxID=5949 RepID=A0A078AAE2_STYLE|nr:UNKNOWN [Stylonychia lemnae]|eukprot:CDW78562.1 UNKNOWN [Stylonychia lemnae]
MTNESQNMSIGDEDDYLSYLSNQYEKLNKQNEKLQQQSQNQNAMSCLEKAIDKYSDLNQEHLNELQIQLKQRSQTERSLATQKKCNDQLIDYQRNQNEDMVKLKHENEMKLEQLMRDLVNKNLELENAKQIKDTEVRNQKVNRENYDQQLQGEINMLEYQKFEMLKLHNETKMQVQDLENEKIKEISSVQIEIKKLEDEIEELKAKMQNKENNPYFIQVNEFYNEVQEYMGDYRKIYEKVEITKELKIQIYQLQRKLNDVEYSYNQNEIIQKKQLDDSYRLIYQEQQIEINNLNYEVESLKQKQNQMLEKRQSFELQLGQVITSIGESKERYMITQENFEKHQFHNMKKQKQLQQMKADTETSVVVQAQIANKICAITIENKTKQDDKEIMMILLQHIYNAIQGKKHNIKGLLSQLEIEQNKSKVVRMLQQYKIPFK